jgi:peptide/nickel transport system substrate-binding protein
LSHSPRPASSSPARPARFGAPLLLALALLLACLAAPAALADSPSPAAGGGTTTLRVGLLEDADSLNPFVGYQITSYMVWHLNYDFLVGFEPSDLSPRPEIAESWTTSEDGKTWTFKIRQGMTWQDGEPVTAHDVAFTFNYIVENDLVNLASYTSGIVEAEAIDDYTAEIRTDAPKSNMLSMVVPILPEHVWSKVSGEDAAGAFKNPTPIVGSGPFQTVEWEKGRYLRLEANKEYWKDGPYIDELIFQIYQNADTMVADFKAGTIDGVVDVPVAQFAGLQGSEGVEAIEATSWKFTELGLNCYDSPDSLGHPVLLDEQFRQALAWAVDRQRVVDVAFNGYATPATSTLVPYNRFHWEPPAEKLYGYDPDKASALLDAAGYVDGDGDGWRETKDGKDISLRLFVTNDYPPNQTTGKLVSGWLADIGIKAEMSVIDAGAMLDAQYNYKGDTYAPDYDMFIWYWTQDPDPYFNITVPTTGQIEGWNDTLWTDPEYDRLGVVQAQELDEAARMEAIHRMQEIILEGAPYVLFTYPSQLEAFDVAKWEGWKPVPNGIEGYTGSALYPYTNIDNYVEVRPKTTTVAAEESSNTAFIVGIVLAVAIAGVIALLVLRRGRGRTIEE